MLLCCVWCFPLRRRCFLRSRCVCSELHSFVRSLVRWRRVATCLCHCLEDRCFRCHAVTKPSPTPPRSALNGCTPTSLRATVFKCWCTGQVRVWLRSALRLKVNESHLMQVTTAVTQQQNVNFERTDVLVAAAAAKPIAFIHVGFFSWHSLKKSYAS